MSDQNFAILLFQMSVMLTVGLVVGQLMHLVRLPIMVGELLAGILLGPTVFGTLAPSAFATLFPVTGTYPSGGENIVKLGIVLFLFVAGLEVNLSYLRSRVTTVMSTSIAGIIVPFILGYATVIVLPGLWGSDAAGQASLALFMGTVLSISALPVIARILMELDLLKQEMGMLVMAAAAMDDLIGWSLLGAVLSNVGSGVGSVGNTWLTIGLLLGLVGLMLSVGPWVVQHTIGWLHAHELSLGPSGVVGVAIALVLAVAALFEFSGTHAFLGAFLLGVIITQDTPLWQEARNTINRFVVGVFVPIYFVSIGLQVNFATNFDLALVTVVFLVACLGKLAGVSVASRISRLSTKEALVVAFGMNARGAMGVIMSSLALEHGLISQRMFVALILMCILTSLISGPAIQSLLRSSSQTVRSGVRMNETK